MAEQRLVSTRLRDSFDDPLFVRTQRGIIPTPRAQALATPVKRLLEEINQLLQAETFDPATATNTFTIAATDYALQAIIVPFMSLLRQQAPHVLLSVRAIEDERIQTQLETGQVDIALMTPESTPVDLHARRLFDERYVCTFRQDHPAIQLPLTLDQFWALFHFRVGEYSQLIAANKKPPFGFLTSPTDSIYMSKFQVLVINPKNN